MIQYIEFRMLLNLSDEEALKVTQANVRRDVTIHILPKSLSNPYRTAKVGIDVPDFLLMGDYEENVSIDSVSSFAEEVHRNICNWYGLKRNQFHKVNEPPYCQVERLTIGQNIFLGNRDNYREDVPAAECIRYQANNKWVYHFGPKADLLTAFHGQGKKLMQLDDSSAKTDCTRYIRIAEGIFSYRFDLTQEQMTKISPKRLLHEIIDEAKLHSLLKEWADKLPKMPVFASPAEIIDCIWSADVPEKTKLRLIGFLKLFLTTLTSANKGYEQLTSASFSRNYSDLKKLLAVPAILLEKHNDKVLFLQPYREWLTESRQGRGEAELVQP